MKRVLLFQKKSSYERYMESGKYDDVSRDRNFLEYLRKIHDEHYDTVSYVKKVLEKYDIEYESQHRSLPFRDKDYDLIITIGGDGTFIRASHYVFSVPILGVNSSPGSSVGFYCVTDKSNFELAIRKLLEDEYELIFFDRLKVYIDDLEIPIPSLNDILFSHKNPAATSSYLIICCDKMEKQKSSGVWIATKNGMTAAYMSAGGKPFYESNCFGFVVREPYSTVKKEYSLLNEVVCGKEAYIKLKPLVDNMFIFIDGDYINYEIDIGQELLIKLHDSKLPSLRIPFP